MKKVLNVIFCGLLGLFVSCEGLVFVREDNGIKHVYKMRYNGSSQMPFSPITGTTYDYPDISPDGTKIAYTDGQNVFLSDLNDMGGSSQQQLSTPSGIKTHVRWAPQQQVIGYANTVSGTASIFLSATNGANFQQATYPSGSQSDGGGLDFYLDNNLQYVVYSRSGDLYFMLYNGTQPPVPITNTPGFTTLETLPVVSHDGQLLAFRVSEKMLQYETFDYIRIVAVGTWALQNSIFLQPPAAMGTISSIAFSCDDKRIYFAAETSSAGGSREIFSVKLDGSDQQQLTSNSVYDSKPDAIPKPCP